MGCIKAAPALEAEVELAAAPAVPLGLVPPLVVEAPEDPEEAVPDELEPLVDGVAAVVTVVLEPTVKKLLDAPETTGGETKGTETMVVGTLGIPGEPEMKVTGVVCEVAATVCEVTTLGWLVATVGMPVTTPRELVSLRKEVNGLVCRIELVASNNGFRGGDFGETYVASLRLPIRDLRHRRVGGLSESNSNKGNGEDDGSAHVDGIELLKRVVC